MKGPRLSDVVSWRLELLQHRLPGRLHSPQSMSTFPNYREWFSISNFKFPNWPITSTVGISYSGGCKVSGHYSLPWGIFVRIFLPLDWIEIFFKEPYKEETLPAFNITKSQYSNPKLNNYKNLSHLYSIPYGAISLSSADRNFKLETLISLRNKTHLFNKFKFRGNLKFPSRISKMDFLAADSSIRDKYHKCFSCDLTDIETKIFKIRVKLEVKVLKKTPSLQYLCYDALRNGSPHLWLCPPSCTWMDCSEEPGDMKLLRIESRMKKFIFL